MLVAQITNDGFDILDVVETNTSIIRRPDLVRLSYTDNLGQLVQLVKTDQASTDIGTLLVSHGNCLLPTGDKQSNRTVAKLLAPLASAIETKQVTVGSKQFTAHLLPIQLF